MDTVIGRLLFLFLGKKVRGDNQKEQIVRVVALPVQYRYSRTVHVLVRITRNRPVH
jgi:hypothetical protein